MPSGPRRRTPRPGSRASGARRSADRPGRRGAAAPKAPRPPGGLRDRDRVAVDVLVEAAEVELPRERAVRVLHPVQDVEPVLDGLPRILARNDVTVVRPREVSGERPVA